MRSGEGGYALSLRKFGESGSAQHIRCRQEQGRKDKATEQLHDNIVATLANEHGLEELQDRVKSTVVGAIREAPPKTLTVILASSL